MKLSGIIVSIILLAFTACRDDDCHYPDVVTDLIELETDRQGHIALLRTDDGCIYTPDEDVAIQDATPDSLYRVRCIFQPLEKGRASIYSISKVLSPFPVKPSFFSKGLKTDPVKVISLWYSGKYINLHLGVMTQEGGHAFHFVYMGNSPNASGTNTHEILLYHNQNEDPMAYTREVFLSCPVRKINMKTNDSISMTIQTFDKKIHKQWIVN